MNDYAAEQLRSLRERGTQPDEDFYRLKVTGNGETNWVNITHEQLDLLIEVVASDSKICEALKAVVQYNWDDERRDYETRVSEDEVTEGHIFQHLVTIDNLLDSGSTATADDYIDRLD